MSWDNPDSDDPDFLQDDDGADERHDRAPNGAQAGGEGKASQASLLVRLAHEAGAECFHSDDVPYLNVRVGDHVETHKLRSRSGRAYLVGLFIDAIEKASGSQAVADALNTLEALALRGPDEPVFVRIAAHDHRIYLDLADSSWRCIEVSRTSWRLMSDPPVTIPTTEGTSAAAGPATGRHHQRSPTLRQRQ